MKELRSAIIRVHHRGIPKLEISRLLDIPLTTVFKDIKRYEETGTNEDRSERAKKGHRGPQQIVKEPEE